MKILWLSNVRLIAKTINKSGTWIHSMFQALNNYSDIEIVGNVTIGNVTKLTEIIANDSNFKELVIPTSSLNKNGFPSPKVENEIINWINNSDANIVHVWGMELFWGTLLNKINIKPSLVEIQGIKSVCADNIYFDGGLGPDILNKWSLLELIYPETRHTKLRNKFREWEEIENIILSNTKCINTQSDWVRQVISQKTNSKQKIYKTGIILREEFTHGSTWLEKHVSNSAPIIFALSAQRVYKGIHTTLEAFALVKKIFPNAKLRIAGIGFPKRKFLYNYYLKYIHKKLRELNIQKDVFFLGNLNSTEIVEEMYKCDIYVNTSFIETYCLSLAEAMALGVPCVASYTSALKELIIDGVDGLLFSLGDKYSCAFQIVSLLSSKDLQKKISYNASKKIRAKSDSIKIAENQISIYKDVLAAYAESL